MVRFSDAFIVNKMDLQAAEHTPHLVEEDFAANGVALGSARNHGPGIDGQPAELGTR